jgi:tRNA (adenine-N(1)-)-methyltransferase non-catalytic subunit
VDSAGQDNRNLCDEGSANQTLQHEEIEQLKSEGASGQTIISQLVSKSATFEKKTVYSQQKYLNKKKKK